MVDLATRPAALSRLGPIARRSAWPSDPHHDIRQPAAGRRRTQTGPGDQKPPAGGGAASVSGTGPDGAPYELDQGGFFAYLVDLTNPRARAWYAQVIAENVLADGVGFMADLEESVPTTKKDLLTRGMAIMPSKDFSEDFLNNQQCLGFLIKE